MSSISSVNFLQLNAIRQTNIDLPSTNTPWFSQMNMISMSGTSGTDATNMGIISVDGEDFVKLVLSYDPSTTDPDAPYNSAPKGMTTLFYGDMQISDASAGAENLDPGYRERGGGPVQRYHAGFGDFHVRSGGHDPRPDFGLDRMERRILGTVGLCRGSVFRRLLRHFAIFAVAGASAAARSSLRKGVYHG